MTESSSFRLGQSRGYDFEKVRIGVRDEVIEQSARVALMHLHKSMILNEDDFITGFFEGVYDAREGRRMGALA